MTEKIFKQVFSIDVRSLTKEGCILVFDRLNLSKF
jgi:hypothetical protein